MFKSFKGLNESIAGLKELPIIQPLQQALSIVKSVVATVSYLPSEYARLYAQIQQLKYDPTTGDVSDVTPESQSTIPDSAISQAKQTVDKLTTSLSSLTNLKLKQDVPLSGVQTLNYYGTFLKHLNDEVLEFGVKSTDGLVMVSNDLGALRPSWTHTCILGVKNGSIDMRSNNVSLVLASDDVFIMAAFNYTIYQNTTQLTSAIGGYFFVNVHTYDIYALRQKYNTDGSRSEIEKMIIPGNRYITDEIVAPYYYFTSVEGLTAVSLTIAEGVSHFYGEPFSNKLEMTRANQRKWTNLGTQDPNGPIHHVQLWDTNPQGLADPEDYKSTSLDARGSSVTIGDVLPDIRPIVDALNNL